MDDVDPMEVTEKIVHEFTHAFGTGMVDDAGDVIPGSEGRMGDEPCALHIREVRRAKLEDIPGLGWR